MVAMCQITGNRDQLINLLLVLAENVANIILVHFQDGYATCYLLLHYGEVICFVDGSFFCSSYLPDPVAAMKTITYSTKPDSGEDTPLLCEKLIPTLERLESLSEVCCLNLPLNVCCSVFWFPWNSWVLKIRVKDPFCI